MIESGSLEPGISPAAFGLPAGTALRYERPAEPLRHLLPSYGVMDSDTTILKSAGEWMLPGWAQIWIGLTNGPITVRVRNRQYAPMGSAVLYGGTSRAMPITSRGGITVAVDVSPMGWARLFDASAQELRDRITPLADLTPPGWVETLVERADASDREGEVKAVLDRFFAERMPPEHRHERVIAAINARLLDPDVTEAGAIAAGLDLHPRTLLRLCTQYFGYGPKMLLRRTRFIRLLTAAMMHNERPDAAATPPGYHDLSHFLRDSQHFLGMTPRQFIEKPSPYMRAALRARTLVLGAPMPLLDQNLVPVAA